MNLSLSWRLNLVAIAVITVILAVFSIRDITNTSRTLSDRLEADIILELEKLQALLPTSLWQYDDEQTETILNLSIKSANIRAIAVEEKGKLTHSVLKDSSNAIKKADESAFKTDSRKVALSFNREGEMRQIGFVHIAIDDNFVKSERSAAITNTIFKVIVLDICLALVLYFLTTQLVFKPIHTISHALHDILKARGT
jgi:hypothetical protein